MKLCRTIIILAALLPFVPSALAQLAPLQLQVIKTKKQVTTPNANNDAYANDSTRVTDNVLTFYTIELSRAMKPLTDVRVRWAVLVQLQNPKRLRVLEGERTCNVPIGGTVSLKTQSIRTGVVVRSTTYGYYGFGGSDSVASHRLAEVKGYEVEVYVEDQRVIVDIQPPDVQQEIDTRKTPIRNENANKVHAPTPTTVPPLP